MKFENVLLIDDDEIYNLLHTRILYHTRLVSTIWTSYNGAEAISFLTDFYNQHKALPSMILLDIDMPVMDGFQFLDEFRKLNLPGTDDVNILLVTSSNDPRDAEKAKRMRIKHYLVKPVELDVMTGVLLSLNYQSK